MARNRPEYRAPLRDYPKQAGAGFEAMLAKRTSFGDFSEGSGRRQCKATARKTGMRCGGTAINGSDYCWRHRGGLKLDRIVKQFHPDAKVLVKDGTIARRYYTSVAFNDDILNEVSPSVRRETENLWPGPRGREYEKWLSKKKT